MVFDPDKLGADDVAKNESSSKQTISNEPILSIEEKQAKTVGLEQARQDAADKNRVNINMAREELGLPHEHEHSHEQEEKKEIKEIESRANQLGGKAGERALDLLKKSEGRLSSLPSVGDIAGLLNDRETREKYYSGWNFDEIRQLYEILFGVDMNGESFEDAQKMRK